MLLVGTAQAGAQTDRNLIRQGNRAFKSQKWAVAETQYRKAISKNQKNPQAIYNLGCALMAQQKDSMAIQQFTNAAQLETNRLRRAASYHNMGVIMQNHHEYAQAIEYYKMALRCNPQDNETRYNLALCKKLLKNNPQNKDKNKDNKDKNKDKNKKDQNKDKNKKCGLSEECLKKSNCCAAMGFTRFRSCFLLQLSFFKKMFCRMEKLLKYWEVTLDLWEFWMLLFAFLLNID